MTDPAVPTKTILLVEDELPFREIYRDALSMLDDFKVIEAEDGEEALAMVQKQPPDLIMLDLVLPQKSGFDVLSQLKNDSRYQAIPIIVYSVIGEKSEIEKALKLGADDYIIKSETPAMEVVNKVKRLLQSEVSAEPS